MSEHSLDESVLAEIAELNREYGTGRVTCGHFVYLLERLTPRAAEDFQFRKGGVGSNTWEYLDGVEAGKKAKFGVVIKNIDTGGTVMLVTTDDKATAGEAPTTSSGSPQYRLEPGQEVELNITEPDRVLVAGIGSGLDYTWFAR